MVKARKRFVLFAMLCVFVLLFILLGIVNGVNFTMASEERILRGMETLGALLR